MEVVPCLSYYRLFEQYMKQEIFPEQQKYCFYLNQQSRIKSNSWSGN